MWVYKCIRLGLFDGVFYWLRSETQWKRLYDYTATKRNQIVYLSVYDVLNLKPNDVLLLLPALRIGQIGTIRWLTSQLQLESPRWFAEMDTLKRRASIVVC